MVSIRLNEMKFRARTLIIALSGTNCSRIFFKINQNRITPGLEKKVYKTIKYICEKVKNLPLKVEVTYYLNTLFSVYIQTNHFTKYIFFY